MAHPEVSQCFITIPETLQLILQTSLLLEVRRGIAMLEMGNPVRIVDLANNQTRLAEAHPVHDQSLVFTGLRPRKNFTSNSLLPTRRLFCRESPKCVSSNRRN